MYILANRIFLAVSSLRRTYSNVFLFILEACRTRQKNVVGKDIYSGKHYTQ